VKADGAGAEDLWARLEGRTGLEGRARLEANSEDDAAAVAAWKLDAIEVAGTVTVIWWAAVFRRQREGRRKKDTEREKSDDGRGIEFQ